MANYAATTAMITRVNEPRIRFIDNSVPSNYGDVARGLLGSLDAYYNYSNKQNALDEQKENKELRDNLSAAIESGDENAINVAYGKLDPTGYVDYLNRVKANREASDLDFARKKELLDIQNQNAMGLARLKADLGLGGGVNVNINPFEKKRIENIAKNIDENISASQSRIDDYNRMEQLLNNQNVQTGGVSGAIKKKLPTAFLNDETQELQSIINKIVPQMRPTGSGSTSDRDMAIFEKATVGLDKNKDANLNIVRGRRAVDENAIAREELRADWVNQGGSLTEFDRVWRDYLNANPIFSNSNGELNRGRISAYDWFGGKRNQTKQENADPLGIL